MQLPAAKAAAALLLLWLSLAATPAALRADVSVLTTDRLVNGQQRQQQQQQRPLSLRRLQSASQIFTLRPQCTWEQGACAPMLSNWNMYQGTPSSPYRRAQLLATGRTSHCQNTHRNATACYRDQAHRCYWVRDRSGKQLCQSADYFELLVWTDHNFTANIFTLPTVMTCPGSKAAEFFSCFSRPDMESGCKQLPNCYLSEIEGGVACLPKWVQKSTEQQFESFYSSLVKLDPKVFGNCAAACWLRQAESCLNKTRAGEATCVKAPYCFWHPENKICMRNTLEFEADFDKQVERLYLMCYETETEKECKEHLIPTKFEQSLASWTKLAQASGAVQCRL